MTPRFSLWLLASLLATSGAFALTPESAPTGGAIADGPATAQTLFDEARVLMTSGRYIEACPKLEESQRLDPASGTLLNLAHCYEALGRLASALTTFREAAAASSAQGNREREREATARAEALVSRVPTLLVSVPQSAPAALELYLDQVLLTPAQQQGAIPLDPGPHTLRASAPGRKPWRTDWVVTGEGRVTRIAVPELEQWTAFAPRPPAAAPASREPTRRWALAPAGVGVVGVVGGSVFGLRSQRKHDESYDLCPAKYCDDPDGIRAMEQARSAGRISTAGFVLGGLGLATAGVLWFAPWRKGRPRGPSTLGVGGDGLVFQGRWDYPQDPAAEALSRHDSGWRETGSVHPRRGKAAR